MSHKHDINCLKETSPGTLTCSVTGGPARKKTRSEDDLTRLRTAIRLNNLSLLKTQARRLERRGLIVIQEGSERRTHEWGRDVGPVWVTIVLTDLGRAIPQ